MSATVLLVDDEGDLVDLTARILAGEFQVRTATRGREALACLDREVVACVVADQRMPEMTGVELLAEVRRRRPLAGRVILSAYSDVRDLMAAINDGGVHAYLTKPLPVEQLRLTVRQLVQMHQLALQNERLRAELEEANRRLAAENAQLVQRVHGRFRLGNLVARSPAMRQVVARVEKVAPLDATVLISGETGAGKEAVATTIHYNSARAGARFVAINCGALSEELLASALFGHVRGAFTGALRDQVGYFEAAAGGTLLLDEIGEMSPTMQVKLLRALQERRIERVGETTPRPVDVRVIAATHRDLEADVRAGRFREDLYFRLNVFRLHIPPLRHRPEDIPDLAAHLLGKINDRLGTTTRDLDREALDALVAFSWPGNVRDLENELEQAVVLAAGRRTVGIDDLSERVRSAPRSEAPPGSLQARLESLERQIVEDALRGCGGNISRTAETLALSRGGLKGKLRRFGLLAHGDHRD